MAKKIINVSWNRRLNENFPAIYLNELLTQINDAKTNGNVLNLEDGEVGENAKRFAEDLERSDDLKTLELAIVEFSEAKKIPDISTIEPEPRGASVSQYESVDNQNASPSRGTDNDDQQVSTEFSERNLENAFSKRDIEDAKAQIEKLFKLDNFRINKSNLLILAIQSNISEIVVYLIEEKKISLDSIFYPNDKPLKEAIKAGADNELIDLLLKNMTLSDIKEQYYAIEDSGYGAAEYRVRDYISTCRDLEMTIRKEARKNPSILLGLAGKLPEESPLRNAKFVGSSKNDHEGHTLGNIVKKIVDAFREMFGVDEMSKIVRKAKNEPDFKSKAQEILNERATQASPSQSREA